MLEKLPPWFGRALTRMRPGMSAILSNRDVLGAMPATLALSSSAFADGEPLPAVFTEDGAQLSPQLEWTGVPLATQSLILVVEDADSPTPMPLVHAIVWGLAPTRTELAAGEIGQADGPATGENSFFKPGWLPPDPPPGHGPHRYAFQLFALDDAPALSRRPGRREIVRAMRGHVLARGLLVGSYERGR